MSKIRDANNKAMKTTSLSLASFSFDATDEAEYMLPLSTNVACVMTFRTRDLAVWTCLFFAQIFVHLLTSFV